MVRAVYKGRVDFTDGDAEIAPGISVHLIGGHTLGLQSVRVHTKRGWVVVASDAAHYYENMLAKRPFSTVINIGDMADGWKRLRALADSPDHIVPGHDPEVLRRYPAPSAALEGIVARLDVAPVA
jgi:glyoxylase-like metal-dependent hydrolase (beta-lactamase superfamily II)